MWEEFCSHCSKFDKDHWSLFMILVFIKPILCVLAVRRNVVMLRSSHFSISYCDWMSKNRRISAQKELWQLDFVHNAQHVALFLLWKMAQWNHETTNILQVLLPYWILLQVKAILCKDLKWYYFVKSHQVNIDTLTQIPNNLPM